MTASAASARIVAGTDGSEAAGRALHWAADEARRRGAALEVVHAWLPPYPIDPQDLFEDETGVEDAARRLLADTVARVRAKCPPGLDLRESLVLGHAADALVDAARGADLLVVGSRGRGGFEGLLLGSVSRKCVQASPCPVVVIPPHDHAAAEARVVVGVDGSDHSKVALRWAAREAALREARLAVVNAWSPPEIFMPLAAPVMFDTDALERASRRLLEELTTDLGRPGEPAPPAIELHPMADSPASALLSAAHGSELLVVGARGLGGFRELLLGSVSQQCLHHSRCPVAVVRAVAAER